jgi:hypothetical protein
MQNIIHQLFSLASSNTKDISILYDYSDNIFDKFVTQYLDMAFVYNDNHKNTRELFSYDIYWNNNPVEYIGNLDKYKNDHIQDIVLFHEFPDNALKKEDKFLLQNRLRDSLKIYTNPSFKNVWSINNGHYIPYGLPYIKTDLSLTRKSLVVLNADNSKAGEFLYSHIKQDFPDASILQNISTMSYDGITDVLQEHNVCISFKKSFDSLVALSCGCDVLSSSLIEEEGVVHIEDFNKINLMIGSVLKARNVEIIKKRIEDLIKKYDLEVFQNEIYNTIRNRIRKPFIL